MIFRVGGATRIVKAARDRLSDRVAIGVLTKTFPPELVDTVVDEAKAREQRKRSLPARLTLYFLLAMCLFPEVGYLLVWDSQRDEHYAKSAEIFIKHAEADNKHKKHYMDTVGIEDLGWFKYE